MRPTRSQVLSQSGGIVHKYWRCHNKEYLLQNPIFKKLYLMSSLIVPNPENKPTKVYINAFCIMDNHSHQLVTYDGPSKNLSDFMRISHSWFGRKYNNMNQRTGKVANERPKTPVIQDQEHAMRIHFYIESNPIRAGMFKFENLKLYVYSSFRFYAFGTVDEFTRNITVPQWYLNLGATPEQRQKKYRGLFKEYLKLTKATDPSWIFQLFIGEILWRKSQEERLKNETKKKNIHTGIPPDG
jgi:REP element-mobilizing transposase RayT